MQESGFFSKINLPLGERKLVTFDCGHECKFCRLWDVDVQTSPVHVKGRIGESLFILMDYKLSFVGVVCQALCL